MYALLLVLHLCYIYCYFILSTTPPARKQGADASCQVNGPKSILRLQLNRQYLRQSTPACLHDNDNSRSHGVTCTRRLGLQLQTAAEDYVNVYVACRPARARVCAVLISYHYKDLCLSGLDVVIIGNQVLLSFRGSYRRSRNCFLDQH